MTKIVTIARDTADSPNMVANDAAILECITQELQALGAEVTHPETELLPADTDIICHMSRTPGILQRLSKAEEEGVIVINSADAVKNCSRLKMTQALADADVPQPEFILIESLDELDALPYPAWIKRADGWSCHKEDVCYAASSKEAKEIFTRMQNRGIDQCIHFKHIEGDIIKFYAVGEDYFHYSYPDPGKSKFGHELINGAPHRYPFDIVQMRNIVTSAAKATGVEIFGGDCIVNDRGEIFLIDLNDFPSFTAVRNEAAKEIAKYIINKSKAR